MNQDSNTSIITSEKKKVTQLTGKSSDQITLNDTGWTSRVYIINNGEIVFKFPRNIQVKEEYKWEVQAYELVNSIDTNLKFPVVSWVHPDLDYFGYKGVIGKSLDQVIETRSSSEKESIGKQLGAFLRQLHSKKLPDANVSETKKQIREYQRKFQLGKKVMKDYFSAAEFSQIYDFVYDIYPNTIAKLGFDKAFCHGDLGYWNIIYEKDTLGIIDFGDIGYYDRSIDFSGMTDEILFEAALDEYGTHNSLREKAQLRIKILPIIDVSYFIEKNDEESIHKTLTQIQENLNQSNPKN